MTPKADDTYYDIWPTAWGPIGAVAGPQGLRRIALPHYSQDDLLALLSWDFPAAVRSAGPFEHFASLTQDYFNGQAVDFSEIQCKLPTKASFSGRVLRACREVPYGRTASYSDLAGRIGRSDASRAVAGALSRNPTPLVVPCHRVTYRDGRLGGFSAPGGLALKQRMLDVEVVR